MRHFAIGDVHGCLRSLRCLIKFVGIENEDTLIMLGDYVDRGPDSCGVLDWLIEYNANNRMVAIRGNHDIMMLKSRTGQVAYVDWLRNGGDAAVDSYAPVENEVTRIDRVPSRHWEFLDIQLVASFETDTHFFVHANAHPDRAIADQSDVMLYWTRINNPPIHKTGKIMVCGHTSQKTGLPLTNGNAICLDTWACGNGWLSCMHVESGFIWQANERGETRAMHLNELTN